MKSSVDPFQLLGVPRRLWFDSEELKSRYLMLSSEIHPDRVHGAPDEARRAAELSSIELNAAYNSLRSPRDRILRFLELSGQAKPPHVQSVPAAALNFFTPVAELTRALDSFLIEKRQAISPMTKVALFQKGLDWTERIQGLLSQLAAEINLVETRVKEIDREFAPPETSCPEPSSQLTQELTELAATLGFLEKWQSQLRERLGALAF